MLSEARKGDEVEIPVFKKFVAAARLPVVIESIEKRLPPEPDIRCQFEGGEVVAFELVEICDSNMAKNREDGDYIRTADPSLTIVRKKLAKRYETDLPVELLCYKNGGVVSPDSYIAELVAEEIGQGQFQFRKIWLFSSAATIQLWPTANNPLQPTREARG